MNGGTTEDTALLRPTSPTLYYSGSFKHEGREKGSVIDDEDELKYYNILLVRQSEVRAHGGYSAGCMKDMQLHPSAFDTNNLALNLLPRGSLLALNMFINV